jgi:hypothetical protein
LSLANRAKREFKRELFWRPRLDSNPDFTDQDIRRRVEAKRQSEAVKLLASGFNSFGVASLIAGIISPAVANLQNVVWYWLPGAAIAFGIAQFIIQQLVSED